MKCSLQVSKTSCLLELLGPWAHLASHSGKGVCLCVCVSEIDFLGQDQRLLQVCLRILALLGKTVVGQPGALGDR